MLHSVVEMLKESERSHQGLIAELEDTCEKLRQENKRTV